MDFQTPQPKTVLEESINLWRWTFLCDYAEYLVDSGDVRHFI